MSKLSWSLHDAARSAGQRSRASSVSNRDALTDRLVCAFESHDPRGAQTPLRERC